jgi:hypothetical protein
VDWQHWIKEHKLDAINLVGSVASILGFAVVIIAMFSGSSDRDAETRLWQGILFVISLIAMSFIIIFCYLWIREGIQSHAPYTSSGIAKIFLKLCVCLLALGVAGDGMIAAIQWNIWLRGAIRSLAIAWSQLLR